MRILYKRRKEKNVQGSDHNMELTQGRMSREMPVTKMVSAPFAFKKVSIKGVLIKNPAPIPVKSARTQTDPASGC